MSSSCTQMALRDRLRAAAAVVHDGVEIADLAEAVAAELERVDVVPEAVLPDVERVLEDHGRIGVGVGDRELGDREPVRDGPRPRAVALVEGELVQRQRLARVEADAQPPRAPAQRVAVQCEARALGLRDLDRPQIVAVGAPAAVAVVAGLLRDGHRAVVVDADDLHAVQVDDREEPSDRARIAVVAREIAAQPREGTPDAAAGLLEPPDRPGVDHHEIELVHPAQLERPPEARVGLDGHLGLGVLVRGDGGVHARHVLPGGQRVVVERDERLVRVDRRRARRARPRAAAAARLPRHAASCALSGSRSSTSMKRTASPRSRAPRTQATARSSSSAPRGSSGCGAVVMGVDSPRAARRARAELRAPGGQRGDLDELVRRVHLAALGAAEAERGDACRECRVGVGGGRNELVRQADVLAHAPHGREQRLAPVQAARGPPPEHLDLERERRLGRQQRAGPARSASRTASSSARCSTTSSACAAIALTVVPPSMRPMFVLASRRGGRLSARAIRQISSIALGRPRLAQEWPPGPFTPMRARRLPDGVHGDVQEAVALQRQRELRLAARRRPRAPRRGCRAPPRRP